MLAAQRRCARRECLSQEDGKRSVDWGDHLGQCRSPGPVEDHPSVTSGSVERHRRLMAQKPAWWQSTLTAPLSGPRRTPRPRRPLRGGRGAGDPDARRSAYRHHEQAMTLRVYGHVYDDDALA